MAVEKYLKEEHSLKDVAQDRTKGGNMDKERRFLDLTGQILAVTLLQKNV